MSQETEQFSPTEQPPTTEELFTQPILDTASVYSDPRHAHESRWSSVGKKAVIMAAGFVAGMGAGVAHSSNFLDDGRDVNGRADIVPEVSAPLAASWGENDFLTKESVQVAPPEFDPTSYAPGEFIGALVIDYSGDYDKNAPLTSAEKSACFAGEALSQDKMGACIWDQRKEYFARRGEGNPEAYPVSVHRFTAGEGSSVNPYLENGPILHTDRVGDEPIVIAMHNVTPIHAPVIWNGEQYDQPMLGINNFIAKGSEVKTIEPSDREGFVIEYTYENTGFFVVNYNANPESATAEVYRAKDGVDFELYNCGPVGYDDVRLVYTFKEISSSYVEGSVASTGDTIIGNGQLG